MANGFASSGTVPIALRGSVIRHADAVHCIDIGDALAVVRPGQHDVTGGSALWLMSHRARRPGRAICSTTGRRKRSNDSTVSLRCSTP